MKPKCDKCGAPVPKNNSVFRADAELHLPGFELLSASDRHLAPSERCGGSPSRWTRPEYRAWHEQAQHRRGFAAMDPAKQRALASKAGKTAHAKGVAHRYSSEEARAAGLKGGQAISADRLHMAQIGRIGGKARAAGLREQLQGGSMPSLPDSWPEDPADFGKLVCDLRQRAGITRQDLANAAGLSWTTVKNIERGKPASPDCRAHLIESLRMAPHFAPDAPGKAEIP